jgi:hypothetical protein
VARVDDEALVDLKRELSNFQNATGNRDYEASLLAGAAQEVLDQAQDDVDAAPVDIPGQPVVGIRPATVSTVGTRARSTLSSLPGGISARSAVT